MANSAWCLRGLVVQLSSERRDQFIELFRDGLHFALRWRVAVGHRRGDTAPSRLNLLEGGALRRR